MTEEELLQSRKQRVRVNLKRKLRDQRLRLYIEHCVAGVQEKQAARLAGYETDSQVNSFVTRIRKDPDVQMEINRRRVEVMEKVSKKTAYHLTVHLNRLDELSRRAEGAADWDAAIKAEVKRGEAAGFYVERKEQGPPGAFSEDKEALKARIKERSVRLGLAKVISIRDEQNAG